MACIKEKKNKQKLVTEENQTRDFLDKRFKSLI